MKSALYCRVSTRDQSTDLQREKLTEYSLKRGWEPVVFEEKVSACAKRRPELSKMLEACRKREVDVVVAWKLDRLFRSLTDLLNTIRELESLGVKLVVVQDQIDLTTPAGRMMVQMIGAMAEFERELIRGRVISGLDRAKANGVRLGAPKKLNHTLIRTYRDKGMSIGAIAKKVKCSKGAVHKVLSAS